MSLVGEFGGTGATFIVPLLLILFMKSKQLKAVGKASIVPVAFAVNEPLLFGAPMILNPYMLIPFVAAGCVNVSVAKFFIDNVGMNGFSFVVPWATPAPIGIFITTNFQLIALVFVAIIILLDAIIYLPFLKAYDKLLCDQEAERAAELGLESDGAAAIAANAPAPAVEQTTASVETTAAAAGSEPVADQPEPAADASAKKDVDGLKVLVLCAGAGTSAMLANAIKEAKAGKIEYRLDKTNIIHCPIGKASFGAEKLTDNFNALMGAIIKAKPAAAKGQYVRSCVVASTMGPGIKVSTAKMIG